MKSQTKSKSISDRPVRLNPSAPTDLELKVQKVQLAIAHRAYELFEARGREHGRDLEDWLQAKSELLCPVSIAMSESRERIGIRANVVGFDPSELEVSVEPSRITILGKRKQSTRKKKAGTPEGVRSLPDQILEVIDLAEEVSPEHSAVEWQAGILTIDLPAASTNKIDSAA